jgi:hypothetical protein
MSTIPSCNPFAEDYPAQSCEIVPQIPIAESDLWQRLAAELDRATPGARRSFIAPQTITPYR